MASDSEYDRLYRGLYNHEFHPVLVLLAKTGESDAYVIAAGHQLGVAELAYQGPDVDRWFFCEAGIGEPPGGGLWVLSADVMMNAGTDTPNGPAEFSAYSRNVVWRRPSAVELWAVGRGLNPFPAAIEAVKNGKGTT